MKSEAKTPNGEHLLSMDKVMQFCFAIKYFLYSWVNRWSKHPASSAILIPFPIPFLLAVTLPLFMVAKYYTMLCDFFLTAISRMVINMS